MSRRGEDGFILIAALWMVAALAALASAYAIYARNTAPSAALPEERLQAEAALHSGLELCVYQQLVWPKPARSDLGAFTTEVGSSRIDVSYRSENARIDLNASPRDLIAGLFQQLGAPGALAGFLADRIASWRGRLSDDDRRREAAIYAKAGLAYGPLGAPFDNVLEISLLPGMSAALAQRALPYLTIFGAGKIDPFVADPVVLASTPGLSRPIATGLLGAAGDAKQRAGALASVPAQAKDFLAADPSDFVRADVIVTLKNRSVHAQVVFKMVERAIPPYEILYWRDEFDGE